METDSDQFDGLTDTVFQLADLLAYQDGAIVSRTIADTEAATLTVFAIDEGQRISEHTAHHDALLQILDGTARITIGDDEYELDASESIVFPAGESHAVEAPVRFKMLLTMVR